WSGSDDSSTGASPPECTGRAAGSDQGTATGISSVYCTSPLRNAMASTGTSDGRRGSNKTTIIALVAPHLTSLRLIARLAPASGWGYLPLGACPHLGPRNRRRAAVTHSLYQCPSVVYLAVPLL